MSNVTNLVPNKPDKDIADDLRKRLIEAHTPILKLLDEAYVQGFSVSVGCGPTPTGFQIIQLSIAKQF
jgi:hypothetical protein